ncbi:MAG: hypothetical protein N2Z22_06930 [Turneriella sp.]|nr:hypothetical protein [Leptospiraceae bacterium]MCX7633047.1 hypothetical protein [Turneriella sp.]
MRTLLATIMVLSLVGGAADAIEFTQKDRDLLIEIRAKMHEIDKRFEQIDKRFDDLKMFMVLLTTIAIAVLSYVVYRVHKVEQRHDQRTVEKLLTALREVAQKDPRLEKALKHAGLL